MFAADALLLAALTFNAESPGEAVALVHAGCARCAWGETGREAATLTLSLDGTYSQHLVLVRGESPAEYRITLGTVAAGRHELTVDRDPTLSAINVGDVSIDVPIVAVLPPGSDDSVAQSMAPILYARPNTIGRFTDLPILMWYEVAPTPRGRRFRYSVIFTNEDGGTETDRLMATWGRTTDIEFVYGVELDHAGQVLAEEFQGPGHEVPPFKGRHEARHPLLWVSTDNNMVSESGTTSVRYAPAPERFDLTNVSREAVMDRHPWSYTVAFEEARREGKIADKPPGQNAIPDPRRFVFVEACGEIGNAALAFAVTLGRAPIRPGRVVPWIWSDRGVERYRIVRDGCFRAAIPLPRRVRPREVIALRAFAYKRPPTYGRAVAPVNPVRLTRVNTVFMLDDMYQPGPPMLTWTGDVRLEPGGRPFDLPIK